MIKEELKKLFNADVQPFEKNDITTSVLSDFDNLILDLIDEEKFSSEISESKLLPEYRNPFSRFLFNSIEPETSDLSFIFP